MFVDHFLIARNNCRRKYKPKQCVLPWRIELPFALGPTRELESAKRKAQAKLIAPSFLLRNFFACQIGFYFKKFDGERLTVLFLM